jgi:hypothetical protein
MRAYACIRALAFFSVHAYPCSDIRHSALSTSLLKSLPFVYAFLGCTHANTRARTHARTHTDMKDTCRHEGTHARTHTYTHTHTHTHTHARTHAGYVCLCMLMAVYAGARLCIFKCVHCVCVCVCVRAYPVSACACACVRVCTVTRLSRRVS